jgi:pilus assembly protein CpaB
MNPRQRRGVLLLAVSALGAVGVFVLVARYVSTVQAQVGSKVTLLRITHSVEPLAPLTGDAVQEVRVPARWAPSAALRSRGDLSGLVAGTRLAAGSFVQQGMLVQQPALKPGQREIAVLVDADTGVAGKVRPGDVVDIEATFDGTEKATPKSEIVVPGARVIDVGLPTRKPQTATPSDVPANPQETDAKVPVTFALTRKQTLVVTYAESFASEVRLALLRQGDSSAHGRRVFQPATVGAGSKR